MHLQTKSYSEHVALGTYYDAIIDLVDKIRKVLPEDTQLQNIIDEIAELLDSTCYKLKNLK